MGDNGPVTSPYRLTLLTEPPTWHGRALSGRSLDLLAVLAGSQDARVSDNALIDALWPEDAPARPLRALHVVVSRLRAVVGEGVVGPQGLNEGAVAHPGVLAAGEHGEQVKAPTAQGPALPGRRLRQENQAVRGGHEAILTHHREAVLHMPAPVATPATVLVAATATGPREGTRRQLTG